MAEITVIQPNRTATPVRCGAYCRVSTGSEEQMHSIAAQRLAFLSGGSLVDVYSDVASGTNAQRPGLLRLLADCRSGRVNRVVTKSISRFARNTMDCLAILRELREMGVTVYFEKENIDTARSADEMMIAVMGGLAQEESNSISRNVRWSLRRRMAAGALGVARVPYGYDKVNGALIVNEEQAKVVRRIFLLYGRGMGARSIANMLNAEELPSPTGGLWNNGTIFKMLSQEKYLGDIRWQKTASVFMGMSRRNTGQADSYYVTACHESIIDRQTFEATQIIRQQSVRPVSRTNDSPFRRKLLCGLCGRSYYYVGAARAYWQCSGRFDPIRPCSNGLIHDDDLHRMWQQQQTKLIRHADVIIDPLLRQLRQISRTDDSNELAQINEIRKRKTALRKMCAEGCFGYGELMTAENELNSEMAEITQRLERQTSRVDVLLSELERLRKDILNSKPLNLKRVRLRYNKSEFEVTGGLVLSCEIPENVHHRNAVQAPEPLPAIGQLALCGACGKRMVRRKGKSEHYWCCRNSDCCQRKLHISDDELVRRVTLVVERVQHNPRLIKTYEAVTAYRPNNAVLQMEDSFNCLILGGSCNKDMLIELAVELANEKLKCISYSETNEHTEQIVNSISDGLETGDFLKMTVRHIYVTHDRVRVKFINGKTVKSERSIENE